MVTFDSTVLVKAIVPPSRKKRDALHAEQFRLHTLAKSLVKQVEAGRDVMYVPSAAIIEVAAVGARLTGKDERGIQSAAYVRRFATIMYDSVLLEEAVQVAVRARCSGFDSIFIACAKHTKSVLITDDRGMYNAARKVGVDCKLLRDMR